MVKNYGILQAIFNLDNDINLNRAFSEPWSIHNPILKSVDSSKDQLNANFLIYSFYHTDSLEHIPQINIKNTDQYNGLDAVNSTKLKYVQIKSSNKLSTEAKFQDTKLLEKIDLDKESDYKQGDYLNNESLKMLPKGSFSQSTDLTNFLTNAIKLENTDLDLSSATNLTKLDIYGTSTKRIDGLKSLIVSNEAPFDGNSPQIDVSYTGLDRSALVNLFKSMPYNVGYSTVGSPTITSEVASGFSVDDYLSLSQSFSNASSFEMVFKVKFDSTLQGGIFHSNCIALQKYAGSNLELIYRNTSESWQAIRGGGSLPQADTWCWIKVGYQSGSISLDFSSDGSSYTNVGTASYTLNNYNINNPWLGRFGKTIYFHGSIDLNNTYIKVNGVPWFMGLATMTKTCSIVGCAGTADLTADDKSIVTNKGWTLQDS